MTREGRRLPGRLLGAAAAVIAIAAAGCVGRTPVDRPVAAPFDKARGRLFSEPLVLRSHGGRLTATFTVEERAVAVAGMRVRGKSYRGGDFIGPTLRVRPGDTIEIRIHNRLREPTNLHTHGFHVSSLGISDNVLRTMPAGSADRVRVLIPRSLPPGTYWYHPHLHGLVEEQIFSGLSGVIIVDGLTERLPRALRDVPQHVVALKDLQVKDGAIPTKEIDSNAPTTRTVNGLVEPVLRVRTNQAQLLHVANIGADIFYRLRLDGTRFTVVAEDANPVGRVFAERELILPPGKRYDVLVRWPLPGTYRLRTLRYSTGPAGDSYPERTLASVRVAGAAVPGVAFPQSLGGLPQLGHVRISRIRRLTFGENAAKGRYVINGRRFSADRVDGVAKLGTTEEWVLRNATREQHPFHLHVDDFQVVSVKGRRYRASGLQDTVVLPARGVVRIRVRFADFTGPIVYHCHITGHEDAGMMGILDVTRTGHGPSHRTLRDLGAMDEAMMHRKHHA